MLSINTNLSSLIAQQSLSSSTSKLNQAIERMSTGFKINHAKDNAANYSISTNMSTQIGAYDVAANNVAMGMDLVTTASDIISTMQDHATRLQALSTQARNGTYGEQSMSAINSEAAAIMAEINRLYSTAEYNNVSLFDRTAYTIAEHLPQAGKSGFIDETGLIATASADSTLVAKEEYNGFIVDPKTYTDAEVAAMTALTDDITTVSSGQKYSISSVDELENLAELVNSGVNTSGVEFVLGGDIDLSSISNWTPIGDYSTSSSYQFKGTFDGNGHVIKNLTIDNSTKNYQGLFGRTASGSVIKNIGLEGGEVKGKQYTGGLVGRSYSNISNSYATGAVTGSSSYVGGLVGDSYSGTISNSYATGAVSGSSSSAGGLVGYASSGTISNSYATGNVNGSSEVGGLVGDSSSGTISNSYATGAVSGSSSSAGGLVGYASSSSTISNSYATGAVTGSFNVGGLVGYAYSGTISNSYATGAVTGTSRVGGLMGDSSSSISNSYATGNVNGSSEVGGLVGSSNSSISNSYATGAVTGSSNNVGGLVGYSRSSISNSYATGAVTGTSRVGGLMGYSSSSISNSYATGAVTGEYDVGGLVGYSRSSISNSYATGAVTGDESVGGLLGKAYCAENNVEITNSISYSTVSGNTAVGALVGGVVGFYQYNWNYGDGDEGTDESSGELLLTNCSAIANSDYIGGYYKYISNEIDYEDPDTGDWISDYSSTTEQDTTFDLSVYNQNVAYIPPKPTSTTLQVGINSDSSCQIEFDTNFQYDLSSLEGNIASDEAFGAITEFINLLSERSTQLGAVQNRLDSALESIEVNLENLVSSRSTIRDAGIAEESSAYIRQQILQQASATLLATANQSPSIALQLI